MPRMLQLVESEVGARTRWHFLVLCEDDDALAVGECSDSGAVTQLVRMLDGWRPHLTGRDLVAERDAILAELTRGVAAAAPQDTFAAATLMGGLEQLLIDLAARAAGEPVWKWLGGTPLESVGLYANINRMPGGRTPSDVAAMAATAVAAGFRAIKCAPFDVPEDGRPLADVGLARIRAIRDVVGEDVGLKVDCHERLPADEVHRILPALAELGITWLEDAFAIERTDELRALRAATPLALAGGELMFDQGEARVVAAEQLVDVLMPDVKHAGGVLRTLGIGRAFPGLAISPHNPSGPVATAAAAHLFTVCPNATVLEYQFGEVPWRSDLVAGTESVVDGWLRLPEGPGLGVDFRPRHASCRTLWSATL